MTEPTIARDWTISVIVPVYNEEPLVAQSLRHIAAFLSTHFRKYEVIVVESGSTDGSGRACDAAAAEHPSIRVIHQGARRGYGSAVRIGWAQARLDLVWIITLDLPFPLQTILKALTLLDSYDSVLSYRSVDPRSPIRRFQSVAYDALLRIVLGVRMRHANSAFKLLKREVVERLSLSSNGWFIDAELVYRLQQSGIPTVQMGVPLVDRASGQSSVGLRTWLGVLRELWVFIRTKSG